MALKTDDFDMYFVLTCLNTYTEAFYVYNDSLRATFNYFGGIFTACWST